MKTRLRVEVVATKMVEVVVEHEAGEDPTERTRALQEAAEEAFDFGGYPDIDVEHIEVLGPAED